MSAAASESDEYKSGFGTEKDRGMEKTLVHHALADLRVTFEREVQREAMTKAAEQTSRVKTPRLVQVIKRTPR